MALQNQTTPGEPDLLIRPRTSSGDEAQDRMALSVSHSAVPNSELALPEPLAPFFEACGGMQTISLSARRLDSSAPADRHLFRQPFFVIGRASECDLVIPDQTASFRHIYVQLVSGRWFFLNLAKISRSASGKGQPESGWFDDDCQLTVGSHVVTRVAMGRAAGNNLIVNSNAEPSFDLPFFELEFVNRETGLREPSPLQFRAPVTLIGASPKCDLFLKDESVSKVHASLVLTPRGMWVVDLLGRGGLSVDGRPAFWRQVHDGTVLQIGRFRLRIRLPNSRITPSPRIETRAAPGNVPIPSPGTMSGGSMSEGAVLALIGQLAEMQNQFFEQSRLQMQWMSDMIAHVGRAQQESAGRDMARIEEIGRELREIKSQLVSGARAGGASRPPASPKSEPDDKLGRRLKSDSATRKRQPRLASRTPSPNPKVVEPHSNSADPQIVRSQALPQPIQDSLPEPAAECVPEPLSLPPAAVPRVMPQEFADERNASAPAAPPIDPHVWLTQRMAALSQEHTSLWRRVMDTLSGKPNI